MKTILLTVALATIFCIFLTGFVLNIDSDIKKNFKYPSPLDLERSTPSVKNTNETDTDLQNSNWYSEAMNNLSEMEYNISFNDEINSYQSPNRSNNMRFIYHKEGFTALSRDAGRETRDEWSIDMKLTDVKRQTSEESGIRNYETGINNSELSISGNKAYIESENIRIDYINNKEGMRQDFIIKNRPEGEGKLRLNLSADTELKMIVGADALMFKDKKGNDKLRYSSLKCWDANHRELRAYFEKNYELGIRNYELKDITENKSIPNSQFLIPNSFSIAVNDEDAVYPITIDPLSESPEWTYENNQTGSAFGFSVATAGDVNGDGYSDVIAGAPFFDNGQTDEGKVYVFHGSAAGLSTFANWIAESDTATSNFGYSVATAGDVNGDGYSDVIIGAPYFENGQSNEGKVYVFHGSSTGLSGTPNWTSQRDQAEAHVGFSVSTAGDVNNDGYSDVIFSAPDFDAGQTDEGKVFLHYGSSSGLSIATDRGLETNTASDNFGSSVSLAGDVNGDGYSDVIIGAINSENGQTNEGRAFIFNGSAGGTVGPSFWIGESNQDGANFGISVSTAGDVNGDGLSDVIIGAHNYEDDSTNEGRAFVFYGNAVSMTATPAWTKDIDQRLAFFGYSVGTAGDVNGDGYGDVIVGAYGFANGESDEGKAYVFFGSSTGLPNTADWTDVSNQVSAYFGKSTATAGDVNGDGFSDIVVGAVQFDNGQNNEGMAFLYTGYADGLRATVNWTFEINQEGALLGYSLSNAGDVNGDGYGDVIIGAPYYQSGEYREGGAFIFHGSASGLSNFPNWSYESNEDTAYLGFSVSAAGDVNGDGFGDVIIGAHLFGNGQSNEGKAFVFHGSASGLSSTPDWTAESDQTGANFGYSVSTAGDVNGDGYSDVIIGAPDFSNGENEEGALFVFHGSRSGLSSTSNWSSESNQVNASIGWKVSTAGDVNGDGYSDVIAGAPNYDNGQTNEGSVFVYHGSSSGLSVTANWIKESNQVNWNLGMALASAGDVNGDGYSDVILGDHFADFGGNTHCGAIYVYHGSGTGLNVNENRIIFGVNSYDNFGSCVSTAGDVNADGYSDVIVCANNLDNGQSDEGASYLYYGSPGTISSSADWSMESNQAGAHIDAGAGAGDVNGDGYSDVITGSPFFDNVENEEGKVFVFYGNRKTGLRSTVQQYEPSSANIIGPGGNTESNGNVKLNLFGRSSFGRSKGKIVYEHKQNGQPFSGSIISKSVLFSGSGTMTDLGTSGIDLNNEVSGLFSDKEYKWRARVQYDPAKNPYQKYGPWKYYSHYITSPYGGFKPKAGTLTLSLTALIEGFYDAGTDVMTGDTVKVYLRNSFQPYSIADSSKSFINNIGTGNFTFVNAVNGAGYYVVIKHRNSIETWSAAAQVFTSGILNYDFTNSSSKAYGNNMVQADTSPVKFALYSGDINQDGNVNLSDVLPAYNDAITFVTGYAVSDVTGNNITDLSDVILAYNCSNLFIVKITP